MPNYLERVASSASRRAAIAKPPVSGPPVLPLSRDFSIASDEQQFSETLETSAPDLASTPQPQAKEETRTTRDATLVAPLEPKPQPRLSHERLSTDSPFTVHVPRTLRPLSTSNVPTPPADEPPRVRASTTIRREELTINKEPAPVVHSADPDVTTESATTPAQSNPSVADQAQSPVTVHTEAAAPVVVPIPRVDVPPRYSTEPSPPPAMPVHLPPATSNATRQDQSRVHIGSLEVLVNNHPPINPLRRAPAPSRTESLNLEKRYLDRFRLRH